MELWATEYFKSATTMRQVLKGTGAGMSTAVARGFEALRGGGAREAVKAIPSSPAAAARAAVSQNTFNPKLNASK